MSHRKAGVTVLEVVIVVMLLAIVATIAAPRFGGGTVGGTVESAAAAEQLASDLRRARLFALTQGRSLCVVVFNSASGSGYRVTAFDGSSCPLTPAVFDPLSGSLEVTLGEVSSISVPPANFRFRSDGSPSAAASFVLTTSAGSITVSVASLTGLVAVQS